MAILCGITLQKDGAVGAPALLCSTQSLLMPAPVSASSGNESPGRGQAGSGREVLRAAPVGLLHAEQSGAGGRVGTVAGEAKGQQCEQCESNAAHILASPDCLTTLCWLQASLSHSHCEAG